MAERDEEGKEREEELTPVGDGVEEERRSGQEADEEARRQEAAAGGGDLGEEEEEDDDVGDVRIGAAEEGGDEEKRRARQEERKRRKELRKKAKDRDRKEIDFLSQRNERLEKQVMDLAQRVQHNESMSVDQKISQLKSAIKDADNVISNAISNNNGDEATEAQGIRDNLRDQLRRFEMYKEQHSRGGGDDAGSAGGGEAARGAPAGERAGSGEPAKPDPKIVNNVREWHKNNDWFDFNRSDEDSAIAGAIDDMLAREGYDPADPSYFEELDRRIVNRLPHLAKGGEAGSSGGERRGKGSNGSGRRSGRGPEFRGSGQGGPVKVGKGQVYVSKERREAMEEAGVWDDPTLRKKYLKKYAEWDRENSGSGE